MIRWPEDLVNDIARRRCVLYLGAGVSANSIGKDGVTRPITWAEFLKISLKRYSDILDDYKVTIDELINKEQYLLACELLVDKIGSIKFGEMAADSFRRPGFSPTEIHNVIYGLDSRMVITPNIDKIYEQCANSNSNGTVLVKKYYEDIASCLRRPDYMIIKAHGCVDDPGRIIFTHQQYNIARYQYGSFYRILDALLLTNTFVFIGCGLNDPDIQLTLENLNFSFPNCKPHFFITAEGSINDKVKESIYKNRNIQILTYNNIDGSHSELLDELKRLSSLVEMQRKKYAETATW